jgi:hypothetical protein
MAGERPGHQAWRHRTSSLAVLRLGATWEAVPISGPGPARIGA